MDLPSSVRYTDPATRPLSALEIAQAEIVRLRARNEELEERVRAINKVFAKWVNVQRDVMLAVEEMGAALDKPPRAIKKKSPFNP